MSLSGSGVYRKLATAVSGFAVRRLDGGSPGRSRHAAEPNCRTAPGTQGVAAPYPSRQVVAAPGGPLQQSDALRPPWGHASLPEELAVLVVHNDTEKFLLMSNAGGCRPLEGTTLQLLHRARIAADTGHSGADAGLRLLAHGVDLELRATAGVSGARARRSGTRRDPDNGNAGLGDVGPLCARHRGRQSWRHRRRVVGPIPANSRVTINVETVDPALANADVSTTMSPTSASSPSARCTGRTSAWAGARRTTASA